MNLKKSIKPISFLKAHAADVIKELNETHGTMIITQHGEAKAVLQDIDEYERIQEALALMNLVRICKINGKSCRTISIR